MWYIKSTDMPDSDNPWKTLHIKEVYDNPWVRVEHRDVINPSGKPGIYGYIHFKNVAVGVIPVDQQGYTWLVGQYRYTLQQYSWEMPEGGCPEGTDPLESAQRELREETGLIAQDWQELLHLHTSNSVTDERGIAYLARRLEQGLAEPDDTEELQLKRLPLDEAINWALQGKITDAFSIAAFMKVGLLRAQGKLQL